MRDSYERFFNEGYISKEDFFDFGLKETIYAPYEKAQREWDLLKEKIRNNQDVFIRGVGRKGSGTPLVQRFYQLALGHENIREDQTNNAAPAKLICQLTGYSKTPRSNFQLIRNYQISHIFGRTKNIYAFTAPWNIVYMPKILDPLTGHEAKGEMVGEFTSLFQQQALKKFGPLIDDFNEIISKHTFREHIDRALSELNQDISYTDKQIKKLNDIIQSEFAPIEI